MADIAFLISRSKTPCDPATVIEHARALSLPLTVSTGHTSEGATELTSFAFSDGRPGMMVCTFLPVPHPDAAAMSVGPLSPSEEDLASARSHMILVGFGIEGSSLERDSLMTLFTAAVAKSTDAIAAMAGAAVNFQRAGEFVALTRPAGDDQ